MRTTAIIPIIRPNGTEVISVPIKLASRRKWQLMEEDSITLYFNLADSVDFRIGDYIDDEVFGHFAISEDPIPADYDPVSGAYKYVLRFDADWVNWKNYILMLTSVGARRVTSWVLTDTLENHLSVVIQNLTAIGYTGYSYAVDSATVPDRGKAVCITYSGTSILDALKALAEAYECEFWVADNVIRFGKCSTGDPIDLAMEGQEINVENMVPTRNDSEYGNRFYAYGSTKNIPETYRKHLSFRADDFSRVGGYNAFRDTMRAISPEMLKRSIVQASSVATEMYSDGWEQFAYEEDTYEDGSHQEYTYTSVVYTSAKIQVVVGWALAITLDAGYAFAHLRYELLDQDGNTLASGVADNAGSTFNYTILDGTESVTIRYSYENKTYASGGAPFTPPDAPEVYLTKNTEFAYFASVLYSGGSFLVRLVDGRFLAVNSRATVVTYTNPPADFVQGTEYALDDSGADAIRANKIPISYYTDDDDAVDSVRILGERRLMLPVPPYSDADLVAIESHIENGYVQRDTTLTRDEVVERVVFFDEIYPRCALRITSVDVGEYANDTTYSDGSKKIANLPAYTLRAELITRSGDVDFPFDPETMMVVGKLTATFLTPDEAKVYSGNTEENASLLMGMTFDVACNRSQGVTTYQLAWNSDYGEKLPNEVLAPKVGDAFILAGWNPAAMASLGLIDAAEKELALTAERYAALLEESQFRFDCTMMSDWVLARADAISATEKYKKLILPGQRVIVHHGALAAPKETRVIGLEYKLDIPYDSPILTVGESEAYSRVREIEKSLHASSQKASASSNTDSSTLAGGGGAASGGGGKTLHLTIGTMAGMSPVDYNGSEEKTFRVPSVVDHLVDSDKVPRIADDGDGGTILVDKNGNEVAGKQFFELVQDAQDPTKFAVKLKSEYTGLWADSWVAAGGIGTPGGGGGGGMTYLNDLSDVSAPNPATNDLLRWNGTAWVNVPQSEIAPSISFSDLASHPTTLVGYGIEDAYTKNQVDGLLANIDLSSYATTSALNEAIAGVNVLEDITTEQNGIVEFVWANGDSIKVDLNHAHSDYVPITRTINGHPLSANVMLSATADLGVASWAMDSGSSTIPFNVLPSMYVAGARVYNERERVALITVGAISYNLSSDSSDKSRIVWEPGTGGTGSWHFLGNIYADGFVAAGGQGEGSGVIISLSGLQDVDIDTENLNDGDILRYNFENGVWENTPLGISANPASDMAIGGVKVVTGAVVQTPSSFQPLSFSTDNKYYPLQVDSTGLAFVNVPWTGGGGSVSWGTYSASSHTVELTVNGTSYVLCENGYSAGGGVSSESDPVFTASPAYSLDTTHVGLLMNDGYALVGGSSSYNFLVNTLRFTVGSGALGAQMYSMRPRLSWTCTYDNPAAIGQTITETKYLAYRDEIPTSLKCPQKLTFTDGTTSVQYDGSVARAVTASTLGAVSVSGDQTVSGVKTFTDGITLSSASLVPDESGTCAVGTSSLRFGDFYGVDMNLSGDLVVDGDIVPATDGGSSLGYSTRRFSNGNIQTIGTSTIYLKNAQGGNSGLLSANGGWMAIRVGSDVNTVGSYKQINFHETYGFYPNGAGMTLGYNSVNNRWATIYGANADLSGDLAFAATSHIDIGPLRIEYDPDAKALRITKVLASDPNEYSFFTDGFIAAGGIEQPTE